MFERQPKKRQEIMLPAVDMAEEAAKEIRIAGSAAFFRNHGLTTPGIFVESIDYIPREGLSPGFLEDIGQASINFRNEIELSIELDRDDELDTELTDDLSIGDL